MKELGIDDSVISGKGFCGCDITFHSNELICCGRIMFSILLRHFSFIFWCDANVGLVVVCNC